MSDAGGNATATTVAYKTMKVQVLRGTESRAVRKWEAQGWELVSQTPATLRTELEFRRPKTAVPWRVVAIGVAVLAVVLAVVIPVAILSSGGEDPPPEASAASSTPSSPQDSDSPTPTTQAPVTATRTDAQDGVLTPKNSPELAAILDLGAYCDPAIATFVAQHVGDTISVDGTVTAVAPRGGTATRYDIGIAVGDDPETATLGPAFQFQDVNPAGDLTFQGANPSSITVGTNLALTARVVGDFNPEQCLFLLDPVSTTVR